VEQALDSAEEIARWVEEKALSPEVSYGLELALLDLLGQRQGVCIAQLLEPDFDGVVHTHSLVTGDIQPGAEVLKIKVGAGTLDADLERIASLRARGGSNVEIRLDAGGGWSQAQALEGLQRFAELGVKLIEEPYKRNLRHTLPNLRYKAESFGIAIAADESVRCFEDLEELIDDNAIDVVVLKPMFVGGLYRALRWARFAQSAGLDVIITHALESTIGRTGAIHLAACVPGVHGLGSGLQRDLGSEVAFEGGTGAIPAEPGLGVAPSAAWLALQVSAGVKSEIPNPLWSSRIARPDHPAVVSGDGVLSYAELASQVRSRAGSFRAMGIIPGMVVGLEQPIGLEWVIRFHALGWLGATVAPLEDGLTDTERTAMIDRMGAQFILGEATDLPSAPEAEERFWPMDEARLLVCTSGSSGVPTPVRLSTRQLLFSAFGSAIRLGLREDDRWLCCLPLTHVGGLSILMRSVFYGTTVILNQSFEAAEVARSLDAGDASLVSLVPTMLDRVLAVRENKAFPTSLRAILVGGASMNTELRERCAAISAPVAPTWGMTESASQLATGFPGDYGSDERATIPLAFARIDAPEGRLQVRGPLVQGRLETPDMGRVDEHGRVFVDGRADDVIISGGKKISPVEIEDVLKAHPGVGGAAVVAIPSNEWGERPIAVLEPSSDERPSADELRGWCGARLTRYKIPDDFAWCDALPRTGLQKISRSAVREALARADGTNDPNNSLNEESAEHLLLFGTEPRG